MHIHLTVIEYHIVHLFNDFWWCCTFWTSFMWITFKAASTIVGNTVGKVSFFLSWYICHKHLCEIARHSIK
jgi:hypothetical protein